MNGRLVKKERFTVIGPAAKGSHRNQKDKTLIGSLWEIISQKIHEIDQPVAPHFVTGVCIPPASPDYYYIAGVEVDEHYAVPDEMVKQTFPALTYLVYTHQGSVTHLFNTYGLIWGKWFPSSGYEMAEGPELEIVDIRQYPDPFSENYVMEIYIPVCSR